MFPSALQQKCHPDKRATRFALVLCIAVAAFAPPAQALPPDFVDAATVVPGLVVEMRYAGSENFVGRPIAGYERPRCLLTRKAAEALAAVARELAPGGLGLKAFDCYRPVRAVRDFVRWAKDPSDQARKADYYPEIDKRDAFRLGYLARRSGHSRGSTIDLTLVRLADKREVAMGTPYDLWSPRSATAYAGVSAEARRNRATLAAAMARHGFAPYAREWWHFALRDEPHPRQAFDDPVR